MLVARLWPALAHRLRLGLAIASNEAARLRSRDPLLPPWTLHSVGFGDFRRVGDHLFQLILEVGRLGPGERVLDVGCGTGRVARPLAAYLTGGSYDGMDIVAGSIGWCRRAYRRHSNFSFHHADLFNRAYNPAGAVPAAEYRFPFDDGSFDFILLISVFTHMLPTDIRHYLKELARLRSPGGRIFMTAFLIDEDARRAIEGGRAAFRFRQGSAGCYVEREDVPEGAVAHDHEAFSAMVAAAGLGVIRTIPGSWRGSEAVTFQDLLILGAE